VQPYVEFFICRILVWHTLHRDFTGLGSTPHRIIYRHPLELFRLTRGAFQDGADECLMRTIDHAKRLGREVEVHC
jgi:hypothetical protein